MITLKNWCVGGDNWTAPECRAYHLYGEVYGHPNFEDGASVKTSRIVAIEDKGDHKEVSTGSGSVYVLYKDDVNPEYEKEYPNAYERLSMTRV